MPKVQVRVEAALRKPEGLDAVQGAARLRQMGDSKQAGEYMTKEDKRITDWLSVLALAMSCVTLLIIFSTKVDLPTVYPAGHGWGEPEASVSITIDPFVGEKTPRAWECNDDGMCGDPNVWDLENAHIIWHSEPTPNPPEAPEPRPQDCSLQPVVPVNASIPVGGSYSLRWPELR